MPCNTIATTTVNLDGLNRQVLAVALQKLGFTTTDGWNWVRGYSTVTIPPTGAVTLRSTADLAALLKRTCSALTVEAAAAKNGWTLKWTAAGKATVTKQTYATGKR